MDDSCSELCKSVCQPLQRRIDDPWLTPQNAANMGEKADGMTHCRPETPENERRFSQQALFSSSTMHLATWQPQLTNDQETRRETLLAHLRVERSYYVLSIILCVINFSRQKDESNGQKHGEIKCFLLCVVTTVFSSRNQRHENRSSQISPQN